MSYKKRNSGNWIKCWAFLLLFLGTWAVSAGRMAARSAALQRGIRSEVLRFHVLANSDSENDQAVKLLMRDQLLQWMDQQMTLEVQNDRDKMLLWIRQMLPSLQAKAEQILKDQEVSYGVQVLLENVWFPERTYGNCTFPKGNYKALRILLGKAKGHNWWCVLFPKLCFLDCVHAVLPEQSQMQLQEILTEEEYESLFHPAKDLFQIRFRYFS